jgi:hypothetical protein
MAAVRRWRAGDFEGFEYVLADQWRRAVAKIDLGAIHRTMRWTKGRRPAVKTLADVLAWVDQFLDNQTAKADVLKIALQLLPVPATYHRSIYARWKDGGGPALRDFAAYARLFYLAIATDLIGRERPSNRIDISYLYYLPFCSVFTSRDGLHRRTAALLVTAGQCFVDGDNLKQDLARLTIHYEGLPDAERAKGSLQYAGYPPLEGDFLVSRLWDQLCPGWRKHASNPIEVTPERNAEIMAQLKPILDAIEADEKRR